MSLFLFAFFLIYGGTHLYFFLRVNSAFHLGSLYGSCLALFLVLMVLAPVLVRALERWGMEDCARGMAYAGYLWMGFLFLFFSASLTIDLYHAVLHIGVFTTHGDLTPFFLTRRASLILPLAYAAVTACYGYYEAGDIRSERVVVTSSKIPREVGKLTIVQISDVHLGLIVRRARLARILEKVKAAAPDILVSTGDLVDGQINRMTGLAEQIQEIRPRFGKYAVTGNHEIYAGLNQALAFTERAGFKVLRGESVAAGGIIYIAGVDDPAIQRVARSRPIAENTLLSGLPTNMFTLLLKHRPVIESESLGHFDLQLSGHVHKGQLFPFNLVTYLFYPVKTGFSLYPRGSSLYVSRGTGTWGPPIRFLAPPEITEIELLPARENR